MQALIPILVTVVLAAVAYVVLTPVLGLPVWVGIVAAVVVVLAAIPTAGFGTRRPR